MATKTSTSAKTLTSAKAPISAKATKIKKASASAKASVDKMVDKSVDKIADKKTKKSVKTAVIKIPTVGEFFDVGAHFGHQRSRSDARAKKFIYTTQNKVNVINLEETQKCLKRALEFLAKKSGEGARFLFVGTKLQAKETVLKLGKELDQAYVSGRWLGGTLTNFETLKKALKNLQKLEEYIASEEFNQLTKREKLKTQEKLDKLNRTFGGLRALEKLPDVLVVLDAHNEQIAVREARETHVATVGICDTDFNPQLLDYPIPANDDSQKTLELIGELIYNTIKENLPTIPKAESKK